jgi:hypothetical protein
MAIGHDDAGCWSRYYSSVLCWMKVVVVLSKKNGCGGLRLRDYSSYTTPSHLTGISIVIKHSLSVLSGFLLVSEESSDPFSQCWKNAPDPFSSSY